MSYRQRESRSTVPTGRDTVSRRSLIKASVGLAMAPLFCDSAAAQTWAHMRRGALGTFPKGVRANTVFVGGVMPLSGPYLAPGMDMRLGFMLAIEHLNHGSRVTQRMPSLKAGSGVLGKQLEFQIADSESNPSTATRAAAKFVHENQAIMLTGGVSSAVSIALERFADRERVIFMVGNSGSNDTTGRDCQRYGFRSQPSAYMAAKALAPVLARQLGSNRKAAYLIPDYNYGYSMYESMRGFTQSGGWTSVEAQLAPVGTFIFKPYLTKIAESGADVFVNVTFGNDAALSTKQAEEIGILKKMKYVVPNISQFQGKELGAQIMGGALGTQPWWWTEQNNFPLAKFFVEDFEIKYRYKPRWGASEIYLQMLMWADAVQRAGSFYPVDVIAALESGHKVETIYGPVWYRAGDHQLARPVPVVVGKTPDEMRGVEDFFHIIDLVPGEACVPPLSETGCYMSPYED
jgi:branched-chain amino acid transport system substrate-binding protein